MKVKICTMALAAVAALATAAPAASAPLSVDTRLPTIQPAGVENVQWRGHWRDGRYHRHHRHHRHYRNGWGPAIGGLAAGAVIGGAIANSQARAANADAYCARKYKSYDPASGTYLGYDGDRHPCP